jgi:uncharacterized protein (DUF1800 family)
MSFATSDGIDTSKSGAALPGAGASALAAVSIATVGASALDSFTSVPDGDRIIGTKESRKAAARVGLHASIGVTDAEVDEIDRLGAAAWLDRQMAAPNDGTSVEFFSSRGLDRIDQNGNWRKDLIFEPMIWAHLFEGGNAVRKRMALALSEIFVVSLAGIDLPWRAQAVGAYWDLLNAHAFSNFRTLLEAVTLSPAMGAYLNMMGNRAADPSTGRVPDENFAREIMQLFTIGLFELNLDGSRVLIGGQPVPTYSNADVEGLAKVFTGFDLDYGGIAIVPSPIPGGPVPDVELVRRPMTSRHRRWSPSQQQSTHSPEEKLFLGTRIPSGTGANRSVKLALDWLANHRNVAPFISKQLIQRLVTSNPSPSYVARVASVFNNNGNGIRGDLAAVFKAIILDPEAVDPSGVTNPFFGKVREPMLRFAQWGRTFGARSTSGAWSIRPLNLETLLNQSPFRSPSVFNFFRPDYTPPRSQASANGMVAPEFQIATDNAVANYVNFIHRTVHDNVYWYQDIEADYQYEMSIASDPLTLLDHLDLVLTAGQLGEFTRGTVYDVIKNISVSGADPGAALLQRVRQAIVLIMCSNDYITQK